MIKTRIYIIQLLGIFVLLCGYFLSDPPDSLSVMHFNPNPDCPTVISKAIHSRNSVATQGISIPTNTTRKTNIPKHISFELMMPAKSGYIFVPLTIVTHSCPLPEHYNYLFYEEINPPPPKAC